MHTNQKWLALYKIAIQLLAAIAVCLAVVVLAIIGVNQVPADSVSANALKALDGLAVFICALVVLFGAKALRIVEVADTSSLATSRN